MNCQWDEFSKALAEPVPRRESLRRLGGVLVGAVVGPLGTAWAAPRKKTLKGKDPCQTFCKCRNKAQQNACLAACKACNGDTRRLCGACGTYYCADLANDVSNCGACGHVCAPPGPYELAACVNGRCISECVDGAVRCSGTCTSLDWDPDNCGACGKVCPVWAPYCNRGACSACAPGLALCGDSCVDLTGDPNNCGACGNVCSGATPYCTGGTCTNCGGYGVAFCDGACVYILSDNANCGACGVQCAWDEICSFGVCYGTCSGC
jgi:hypothetical protein